MPENTAKRTTGKIRLTDANASRFRPGAAEYTVRDTKTPGLGVRVKPSGYRVWVYHGSAAGSPRRHSLGPIGLKTVEDARLECLEIGLKEQISGAPDETVKVAVPKFRDFVEEEWKTARYNHLKPSTRKGVDSAIKSQLLPNFGTLPLDRITRSRVNRWFDQYSRSAPGGANYTLDTLSRILNHAIVCGHIAANPTRGVRRNPRQKMTRFLSREEIRRLHAVLDAHVAERPVNAPVADIIRLLLLTGCRRGEILNLQWREVGEDILELVDSKTGPRTVFLSPKAKAIIERQPRSGSPWVFPSPVNREKPRSANALDSIWKLTRKQAGIEDVRLHDLRHSVASQAVLNGVPLPVVARILGHSQVSMTLQYAHVADKEVEAAAQRVGRVIANLCGISDP